jgi:hypothetical protein
VSKNHRFLVAYQVRHEFGFSFSRIFLNGASPRLSRATILGLEKHLAELAKVSTRSAFVTGVSYLGEMSDEEFAKSSFTAEDALAG